MRRSTLWPLLPAAVLALVACGSDSTVGGPGSSTTTPSSPASTWSGSSAGAIPACAQVAGTTSDPSRVLCVGTAGVSPLGTKGGVVRITVKDVFKAETYSLDELKVAPSAKMGKDLWFADLGATIVRSGADLDTVDPGHAITIRYDDDDRAGTTSPRTEPSACRGNTFVGSLEGATITSCAWALLPAGQQPTTVAFLGNGGTMPTAVWAAKS